MSGTVSLACFLRRLDPLLISEPLSLSRLDTDRFRSRSLLLLLCRCFLCFLCFSCRKTKGSGIVIRDSACQAPGWPSTDDTAASIYQAFALTFFCFFRLWSLLSAEPGSGADTTANAYTSQPRSACRSTRSTRRPCQRRADQK